MLAVWCQSRRTHVQAGWPLCVDCAEADGAALLIEQYDHEKEEVEKVGWAEETIADVHAPHLRLQVLAVRHQRHADVQAV